MTKTVFLFGFCLAALLVLLKWVEYSFFAHDLSLEAYVGIVALFCTSLGAWIGWKLTRPKSKTDSTDLIEKEGMSDQFKPSGSFGLSPREHEVLVLIANGHSYREIADKLSISLSTVKTHASNLFSKMDVQRRTQAILLAQKSGLLPPTKG